MQTYVAEIQGEPILAYRAANDTAAREAIYDGGSSVPRAVCLSLVGLHRRDGTRIWDGLSPITVRPAAIEECRRVPLETAPPELRAIAYLVEVADPITGDLYGDDDEDESDVDMALARNRSHSISASILNIEHVHVTAAEFWSTFGPGTAMRASLIGAIRSAIQKLTEIENEFDRQAAKGGVA